jgi:putative ABC transport system permease protein
VAIISEKLARKYFAEEDPVGRQIRLGNSQDSPWITIVGVAGDVLGMSLFNEMKYESEPVVYRPLYQSSDNTVYLRIRSHGEVSGLSAAVQREVAALDPGVPVHRFKTMDEEISASLAHPRFRALLFGIFAGVALLLAVIGIYGLLSESVAYRIREIGIRMALGAEKRDVVRLVLRQSLLLTVVGAAIGVAGALTLTRFVQTMLFDVEPTDPVTFAVVIGVLGLAVVLASYLPARRAIRVDPMIALRND